MNKTLYAVGKYYGNNDVDVENLKYFDNYNAAIEFYVNKISQNIFGGRPVLAVFTIVNNKIIGADYLIHRFDDLDIGPIGPSSTVVIMEE